MMMMTKRMWKLKHSGAYSIKCARDGEMAVRDMSDKAQEGREDMDGLTVYEYMPDDTREYAYFIDSTNEQADGLTFDEMEEFLEGLAPEPDEDDEEEDFDVDES